MDKQNYEFRRSYILQSTVIGINRIKYYGLLISVIILLLITILIAHMLMLFKYIFIKRKWESISITGLKNIYKEELLPIYNTAKYYDMYNTLTIRNNRRFKFKSFEEIDTMLRKLGWVQFVPNLSLDISQDRIEETLNRCETPAQFIREVLEYNSKLVTQRWSNRFKTFVKSGNSDINKGSNRSMLDIIMLGIRYRPEWSSKDLYNGMKEILEKTPASIDPFFCSTINKRVYPYYRLTKEQPRIWDIYHTQNREAPDELNIKINSKQVNNLEEIEFNFSD